MWLKLASSTYFLSTCCPQRAAMMRPLLLSLTIAVTATASASQHGLAGYSNEAAPKCWPGKQIHDPCDGFVTGWSLDGILVSCSSARIIGTYLDSKYLTCARYLLIAGLPTIRTIGEM